MATVPMLISAADLNASTTAGAAAQLVPTGTVFAFAGTSAPAGWLACNGNAISRTTYADLYAALGVAHGYGDNSTTFNLPDYRGRFVRGADAMFGGTPSDRDPNRDTRTAAATGGNTGNAVGSVQSDGMQGHYHGKKETAHTHTDAGHGHSLTTVWISAVTGGDNNIGRNGTSAGASTTGMGVNSGAANIQGSTSNVSITAPSTDGANGTPRTSPETRPANAYVNYIIKI